MTDKLRLQVLFDAIDRVTAPLKRITAGSGAAGRALKEARDRLKALNDQQLAVGRVKRMAEEFARLNNEIKARTALLEGMRRGGTATAAQIKREEQAVKKLAAALEHQREAAGKARLALNAMGLQGNLGAAQARLKADMDRTTAAIDRQRTHLQRLSDLRNKAARVALKTGAAVAVGYGMQHAGMAMVTGLQRPMHEGRSYASEVLRIGALGLGDEASAEAVKFARGMQTFGTSMVDNIGLMRDAITVFGDVHHAEMVAPMLARMKFANEAVFGAEDAAGNEAKFMDMLKVIELRGGLASQAAFENQANIVQRVLTATGGRVGPSEWLELIKTGGVAAKGIGDEAFYYQLEPLVQEMGGFRVGTALMSAYQNIYQGKTTKRAAMLLDQFGLIADPSKVKHDKVGQIAQLGVGALKGSDLFRQNQFEWMEKVLLPALAEKGITDRQDVLDAMGGMFSNRTASNLFAQMYLQRDQIHKNATLNSKADGIDQLYTKAQRTPAGQELELRKKLDDAYLAFSTEVMPAYIKALEAATGAIKGVKAVMDEFPLLTKVIGVGFGTLALGMAAMGAVLIPLALVVGKMMLLRLLFSGVALAIGVPLAAIGAMAAAIAAVGVAAYMLYDNWEGVVGGFNLLMRDLVNAVVDGIAGAVRYVLSTGAQWYDAGASLIQGLANGITSRVTAVRDAISLMAGDAVDWFKDKLGIRSPSRVFMELGAFVGQGAALGIQSGAGLVRHAALGMASASLVPMTAMATVGGAGPGGMPMAVAAPGGNTYQITINAAPGMDERALARAVTAELDRRDRTMAARRLSRLSDID